MIYQLTCVAPATAEPSPPRRLAAVSATFLRIAGVANPSAALLGNRMTPVFAVAGPRRSAWRCATTTTQGKIKGPSATQVHGTVAVGLIAGFLLLFLILSRVTTPAAAGELAAIIPAPSPSPTGSTQIVVRVTNNSTGPAQPTCRVQRGGSVGRRRHRVLHSADSAG
jgi:hypothetical protein